MRKKTKKCHLNQVDEKLSDLVGFTNLVFNNKFKLNYNFAIDQNYQDFNYSEVGTDKI